MLKRLKNLKNKDMSYRRYSDIPKVDGRNIQFIPKSNKLIFENISPVNNEISKPTWWKNLSTQEGKVRRCSGISDLLSLGYTINMWSSCAIQLALDEKNWTVVFDAVNKHVVEDAELFKNEHFDYNQTGECPMTSVREKKEANYIKMVNPWLIKTCPGYSSLILPVMYEPNNNYSVLPAIINTDYYHHANVVLNVLTDKPFRIPYGTPMMHIIPFKRHQENNMEILDESAYGLLEHLGFGSHYIPRIMRGLYKRTQHKADFDNV